MTRKKIMYKEDPPAFRVETPRFREEKPVLNALQLILCVIGAMVALLGIAMILLLMTSCSVIDEDTSACSPTEGKGGAIAFGAVSTEGTVLSVSGGDSTDSAQGSTRTAEGTMTLDGTGGTESLRDKGFGVFACHTGVHPYVSTSTTANLMWNQLVEYNSSTRQWQYTPLVYWPNGEGGLDAYVTFFAYGPHSDNANGCIADMSNAGDVGDPWIVYQLGGSEQADGSGGWKARQVDLVYDFRKDCRRGSDLSKKVDFSFRHALASIGDRVTVGCGQSVANALSLAYQGTPLTLVLKRFTLDYVLTRKGRLILNSNGQPNWEAVESEDSKVHRLITFEPDQRMAYVGTSSRCDTYTYQTEAGNGVFYIPVESGLDRQRIELTADYEVQAGSPATVVWEGRMTGSTDLSMSAEASKGRNLTVTLQMPEVTCTGGELTTASVGQVICSHGRVHDASTAPLSCLGAKVAVVTYVGSGSGLASPYNHGLALALEDAPYGNAETYVWANAADAASAWQYQYLAAAGAHPDGTSAWFLPSQSQWNLMVMAVTGDYTGLTASENDAYKAAMFNPTLTAAGATGVRGAANELYWSSTASSDSNAYYMSFESGKSNSTAKTTPYYVRPVLAF